MVWRLYEHGICFVDLAPLADPRLIPSALAAALGVAVADDPTEGVIAFLSDQRMLVVCDSCEHVGAAAVLVEKVLKDAPGVDVLATSREPLRAEGEGVYRLPPLETPPTSTGLTAVEALTFQQSSYSSSARYRAGRR